MCKNSTYCNCQGYKGSAKPLVKQNIASNMSIVPQVKNVMVLDANNEPMPNVYVSNLTTNKGTITNFDGKATIAGSWFDTIEINHMTHDVEQFQFGELPNTVKLTNPHSLNEVTVIGQPRQAGIGIAIALAGLGILLAMNTGSADSPKGLNAPKNAPLKVTL